MSERDERVDIQTANRLELVQAVFAGCLVLFTLGQVVIGHWQWGATRDQYNAMMEQVAVAHRQLAQAELDQRPWLSITVKVEEPRIGEPFEPVVSVFNSGKSPARVTGQITACIGLRQGNEMPGVGFVGKIGGKADVVLYESFLQKLATSYLDKKIGTVIAPGKDVSMRTADPLKPHILTERYLKAIVDEEVICFVVSLVEYTGPSGRRFSTRSCCIYNHGRKTCNQYQKYNYMD